MFSWINKLFGYDALGLSSSRSSRRRQKSRGTPRSCRPAVEQLEDRLVLSPVYDALLLSDLATDAEFTRPFRINEQGDVAGEVAVGGFNPTYNNPIVHAALWTAAGANPPMDLGDLPLGNDDSQALDVNNRVNNNLPQVTGNGSTGALPFVVPHAFLWTNGNMTELAHLHGAQVVGELTNGHGLNDAGQVVGESPGTWGSRDFPAAYWFPADNYAPKELPDLPGGLVSGCAYEINNSGYIVGRSSVGFVGDPDQGNLTYHAVRWVPSGDSYIVEDLLGEESYATDINDKGQIVGQTGDGDVFIWLPTPDYGLPQGMTRIVHNAAPFGINNSGQVVGTGGFLWDPNEGLLSLADLVPNFTQLGVSYGNARDINDQGQVVIEGFKDGYYQGVVLTPIRQDSVGIAIVENGGSTTATEGGAGDTYTLVLTSQPTASVTISLSADNQVTANPTTLTFTTANWNVPQTVTVSAVDDTVVEGSHTGTIRHTAASSDASYNNFAIRNVTVTITDNDAAGVSIVESGGSTSVTEGGAGDSYTMVLTSQPTSNVTINLIPDNQMTASPTTLNFTSANWNVPQTVTVAAVDDVVVEGSHQGAIRHTATSGDARYNGLAVRDVTVTITDNDAAGVSIVESGGSTTVTEGGAGDNYTLVLTSEPTSSVTITLSPDTQVNVNPTTVTFNSANWNVPRTVTVLAVDDAIVEGTHQGTIRHTATSADSHYNGIAVASVTASIRDDDFASQFDITLNFAGSQLTASQRSIFAQAAAHWSTIILGDLPDVVVPGIGPVDDVYIDVSAITIDGPGGVLGQAGPLYVRPSYFYLPASGIMEFDAADLSALEADGQLDEVIMHEMGHVLGFGTAIWDLQELRVGTGTSDPRFVGSQAVREYQQIFSTTQSSVPLENTGGPGTRDAHWRESVFANELMTGYLNAGTENPLSRMTVAAMADIGYQVNFDAAENYHPLGHDSLMKLYSSTRPNVSTEVGPTLNFADAFSQEDGDWLARSWTQRSGGYDVLGGNLVGNSPSGQIATAKGMVLADASMQADFVLGSNQGAGLVARYQADGSYYLGMVYGNGTDFSAYIFKYTPGVGFTQLNATPAVLQSGAGTLRFEVVGNSLKLFGGLDADHLQLLTYAYDQSLPNAGQAGIRSSDQVPIDNFRIDAITAAMVDLPFTDTFTQPDGNQLSHHWTERNGNFHVENNELNSQVAGISIATINSTPLADAMVQANVNVDVNQVAGLVARYQADGSYYLATVYQFEPDDQPSAWLFKFSPGAGFTQLTPTPVVLPSGAGTLRFEVVGNSLKLYFNSESPVLYAFDSTISSPGLTGLRCYNGAILDNFKLDQVSLTAPALPFADSFTQPDDSQLARNWIEHEGNFSVKGNELAAQELALSLATVNTPLVDAMVQADVHVSVNQVAGLIARYQADGSYYLATIYRFAPDDQPSACLYKFSPRAGFTQLAEPVPFDGSTVRFEVVGDSLKLYFGPDADHLALKTYAFDATITQPGQTGLRNYNGATADNFKVDAVSLFTPALPFNDVFTQPDGSQLARNWTEREGNFSVRSGKLSSNDPSTSIATVNTLALADVSLQADIDVGASQVAGLIARYQADGSYYLASVYADSSAAGFSAALFKFVPGIGFTRFDSATALGSGKGTLRFVVVGNSLSLFFGADPDHLNLVVHADDASLADAGLTGIRGNFRVPFDNFSVANRTTG